MENEFINMEWERLKGWLHEERTKRVTVFGYGAPDSDTEAIRIMNTAWGKIDERYNVEKSTEAACKYLQSAYNKFGNWTMAAASYNMGKSGIDEQISRQKTNNYYNLNQSK